MDGDTPCLCGNRSRKHVAGARPADRRAGGVASDITGLVHIRVGATLLQMPV